jgi:hypothetical protein
MPAKEKVKLNPEEKIIVYWETIKHISELNRTAELKAGLIMSFYGLVLGVVFEMATSIETNFKFNALLIILILAYLFLVGGSLTYSFKCFLPRIETNYDKNMFFFFDIITHFGDIKSFSKKFHGLLEDDQALYDQLGQQIYVHGLIASKKLGNVNKSVRFLVYSFIPMMLAVVTVLAMVFVL